jgi:hypothetical protein
VSAVVPVLVPVVVPVLLVLLVLVPVSVASVAVPVVGVVVPALALSLTLSPGWKSRLEGRSMSIGGSVATRGSSPSVSRPSASTQRPLTPGAKHISAERVFSPSASQTRPSRQSEAQ